jgi:WD40 repeat protein
MATRPKSSDEKTQEWVIWDPFSRQITGQFKSRSQSAPTEVGDYLVFQCDDADGSHLELRAKNTGRLVSRTPARPFWLSLGSPDGRYLAMEETKNRFAMVEIPGWQALWTIAEDVHSMAYSNDSNTVFVHLVESHELNAYDCKTGRRRFELRLPRASRMDELVNVRTTADRKTVVIMHKHGIPQPGKASYFTRLREWLSSLIGEASDKHDITVVVDADSCRERLRVVGYDTSNFTFSEDGQTLVTVSQPEGHQDCTIRCWDVDGWKPLLWPVGIPIGLGACVQVLCWWTCRGTIKQSDPPAEKPA